MSACSFLSDACRKYAFAVLITLPLSVSSSYGVDDQAEHPSSRGTFQIYVDPATGEHLSADSEKANEIRKQNPSNWEKSGQTNSSSSLRKNSEQKNSSNAPVIDEDQIIELPGGGRMIDLRGQFKASFKVTKSSHHDGLHGTCEISHPHRHY